MINSHQLVVLASGLGSRLRPLTNDRPKCMVKYRGKSMIDYLRPNFCKFKNTICVAGYKAEVLEDHLKNEKNLKFAYNRHFSSRNMVYSLFCATDLVTDDLIVSYSDIIFDCKILEDLSAQEESSIAVNTQWLEVWKKRMSDSEIIDDAEEISIADDYIESLGGKITSKMPDVQYMGIIKITKRDFLELRKLFISLNEEQRCSIDMTKFINLATSKGIVKFKAFYSNYDWIEIDSGEDLKRLSI